MTNYPARWAARVLLVALLGIARPAGAQGSLPDSLAPVADVLAAVVGIRSRVPARARSAEALGTERTGSGIVIDGSGLVVTVGYLILEASEVEIALGEKRRVDAVVVGYDHDSGLGLVRAAEPLGVVPMPLGDSGPLAQRQPLLVSSHGGLDAVRPVVLVSRREFAGYWEYLLEDAIFTWPPHPQFGGAALVDENGALVGIGSLVVRDAQPGPPALPGNVFIPVDHLKAALPHLLTAGRSADPRRPWLGIYADLVSGRGLVVGRLAEGGPAAAAGVEVEDLLLGVGDEPVTSIPDFYRKLWASGKAGDTVRLTVLREAEIKQIDVRSMDRYDWLVLQ